MARKVISNAQYLSANRSAILKNAKNSGNLKLYLNKSFERYRDNFYRYPGTLEKPNKSLWISYFKKQF